MKAGDRLVAWLAVALSVAGCGVESGGTASERAVPIHPTSRLRATAGERVVRCWFPDSPGSRRGRLVTFVVPEELAARRRTSTSCTLSDPEPAHRHAVDVRVGVRTTLAAFRASAFDPFVITDVNDLGDDAVLHLVEDDRAIVFDGREGAILNADVENDGEPMHQTVAQARDLRVVWSVPIDSVLDVSRPAGEARDGIAALQVVENVPEPPSRP